MTKMNSYSFYLTLVIYNLKTFYNHLLKFIVCVKNAGLTF